MKIIAVTNSDNRLVDIVSSIPDAEKWAKTGEDVAADNEGFKAYEPMKAREYMLVSGEFKEVANFEWDRGIFVCKNYDIDSKGSYDGICAVYTLFNGLPEEILFRHYIDECQDYCKRNNLSNYVILPLGII